MKEEAIILQEITRLFNNLGFGELKSHKRITASGSPRLYFRLISSTGQSYVAAYSEHIPETETFLYFTGVFANQLLSTPKVYGVSDDKTIYIIEDVGEHSLLDVLHQHENAENYNHILILYYKRVLQDLLKFQIDTVKYIDFRKCFAKKKFDNELVTWDLNYFKYYFARLVVETYDEPALEKDFSEIKNYINNIPSDYFMFRDFQARNIQVREDELFYIDYQGGMKGPLQYDLASLLYQARAGLTKNQRTELFHYYVEELSKKQKVDKQEFEKQFYVILFVRVLQTLGAYGFRGLYQKKFHFINSIAPALKNLGEIIDTVGSIVSIPELKRIIHILTSEQTIQHFNSMNKLTVTINSFSYKRGIPADLSGNGGGFVFDCRAIPNPGKYDEYKAFTGMDKPVIEFLDKQDEMQFFLDSIYGIVSQSIKRYVERGFTSLMVNFGCTGGQHRSVYAAEHLAEFVKKTFDVKVDLRHREQEK